MKSNIKNDHMKDIIVVWRALARSYQLWYLTFLSKYLIMKVHKHGFQSSINAGRYQFTFRLISCFSQFLIRKWENFIRFSLKIENIGSQRHRRHMLPSWLTLLQYPLQKNFSALDFRILCVICNDFLSVWWTSDGCNASTI